MRIRNYFEDENWIRMKIDSGERKQELKVGILFQTEFKQEPH